MSLIALVLILVAIGVLMWLFNTKFTAIDGTYKQIINIVVLVVVVLWLLKVFGLLDAIGSVRV